MRTEFSKQNVDVWRIQQVSHHFKEIVAGNFVAIRKYSKALADIKVRITHQFDLYCIFAFGALNNVLPCLRVDTSCKIIKALSVGEMPLKIFRLFGC